MASRFPTMCWRLAVAALPLLTGGCVDLAKPEAVAVCAALGNCTNGVLRDANVAEPRDAFAPDQTPASDAALPPPADAAGRELPGAAEDSHPADVAGESPTDAATADAASATDRDVAPEGGFGGDADARSGVDADLAALPDLSPENGLEVTPDLNVPGAEPGREPGPEPGRELGPEAGPEAGPAV